jgi:hypothetical protein
MHRRPRSVRVVALHCYTGVLYRPLLHGYCCRRATRAIPPPCRFPEVPLLLRAPPTSATPVPELEPEVPHLCVHAYTLRTPALYPLTIVYSRSARSRCTCALGHNSAGIVPYILIHPTHHRHATLDAYPHTHTRAFTPASWDIPLYSPTHSLATRSSPYTPGCRCAHIRAGPAPLVPKGPACG